MFIIIYKDYTDIEIYIKIWTLKIFNIKEKLKILNSILKYNEIKYILY